MQHIQGYDHLGRHLKAAIANWKQEDIEKIQQGQLTGLPKLIKPGQADCYIKAVIKEAAGRTKTAAADLKNYGYSAFVAEVASIIVKSKPQDIDAAIDNFNITAYLKSKAAGLFHIFIC